MSSFVFCSVVKLWDLRRTYTISKVVPPVAWHSFTPTGDPERPFGVCLCVDDDISGRE